MNKITFFSLPKFKDFTRIAVEYSKPSQTFKLERFVKMVFMISALQYIKYPDNKSNTQISKTEYFNSF